MSNPSHLGIKCNSAMRPAKTSGDHHHYQSMNKMMGSVPQTANNVVYSKRKKPTTSLADTVKVHVMKLEDLPDPLTKREFREVC